MGQIVPGPSASRIWAPPAYIISPISEYISDGGAVISGMKRSQKPQSADVSIEDVRRFYDPYFSSMPSKVSNDVFKEAITQPLHPFARGLVVDVACGKGDVLEFMVRRSPVKGLGMDLS